jgi:hypothetical protein
MLWNASKLRGLAIEATDGPIGTVDDLLFDDQTWQLRWLVVHTGLWLLGRKVLLPLSALGKPSLEAQNFSVQLTMQQVKDSPGVTTDLPVSRQLEARVYGHYNWDPYWQTGFSTMADIGCTPVYMPPLDDTAPQSQIEEKDDPHLRSVLELTGYHMEAQDGAIGHAEDFIVDDTNWHIGHVIIDTKNWLPGQRLVISPKMIREIDWIGRSIFLETTLAKIQASLPYHSGMTEDGSLGRAEALPGE